MEYKLSTEIYGHKADVRAVAVFGQRNLISCSRDKTAKLWKPSTLDVPCGYVEAQTFTGHKHYVSTICALSPSSNYPDGMILTGGHDHHIRCYEPGSQHPVIELKAHDDVVCKITCSAKEGVFMSASWDKTACVWKVMPNGLRCITILKGHEASVWCVLDVNVLFVTGSADKRIIVYNEDGSIQRNMLGHEDCVRDIVRCGENEIFSCGNDALIKRWNVQSGQCILSLEGHNNFIYSLSYMNGLLASGGEDGALNIWRDGLQQQSLFLPAQSAWAVAVLQNEDIVVGCSDGVIRIFSSNSSRHADLETQKKYEHAVEMKQKVVKKDIGGMKISDLPRSEGLLQPGKKDGQTKMISEGGVTVCYSWSEATRKWLKIGNVVGGSGGTAATSGRVLYEGKEYDYVFDVEVEGDMNLKLPYNVGEDPWHVAQGFIHKHELPQSYLDQIANFIIKNSKTQPSVPSGSASAPYVDPFTGNSRYVPGSSSASNNSFSPASDPFTGAARYVPGSSSTSNNGFSPASDPFTGATRYVPTQSDTVKKVASSNSVFPITDYFKLEQKPNLKNLFDKLCEFNELVEERLKLNSSELEEVVKLVDILPADVNASLLGNLKKMLLWPNNLLFPALDILRLAVRNDKVNSLICTDELFNIIKRQLEPDSAVVNQMLTLRTFCNMCIHKTGNELMMKHKEFLMEIFSTIFISDNKALQIALATLMLNMSITFTKCKDKESMQVLLLSFLQVYSTLNEQEAVYRVLLTLGNILSICPELKLGLSKEIKESIAEKATFGADKNKEFLVVLKNLVM